MPDLFKDMERPKWSKPSTTRVFLLNNNFVLTWQGKAGSVGEMCLDAALDKAK